VIKVGATKEEGGGAADRGRADFHRGTTIWAGREGAKGNEKIGKEVSGVEGDQRKGAKEKIEHDKKIKRKTVQKKLNIIP